jgi:hypothetical protein
MPEEFGDDSLTSLDQGTLKNSGYLSGIRGSNGFAWAISSTISGETVGTLKTAATISIQPQGQPAK